MKILFTKIFSFVVALILSATGLGTVKSADVSTELTQRRVVLKDQYTKNRFAEFFDGAEDFAVIPGLKERLIPQGVGVSEALNSVVVTGYYENKAAPSVMAFLDLESGALQKTLILADRDGKELFGHFGGVSAYREYIFAASGSKLYVFSAKEADALSGGEKISPIEVFDLPDAGSFCTVGGSYLVTGTFISDADAKKAEGVAVNAETFYAEMNLYRLSEEGYGFTVENNTLVPDFTLAIPNEVQGVAVTEDGTVVLSCSYGRRRNSRIHIFRNAIANGKEALFLNDAETLEAPPMTEGLAAIGNDVLVIFESGAEKYRRHFGFYPMDQIVKRSITGE